MPVPDIILLSFFQKPHFFKAEGVVLKASASDLIYGVIRQYQSERQEPEQSIGLLVASGWYWSNSIRSRDIRRFGSFLRQEKMAEQGTTKIWWQAVRQGVEQMGSLLVNSASHGCIGATPTSNGSNTIRSDQGRSNNHHHLSRRSFG